MRRRTRRVKGERRPLPIRSLRPSPTPRSPRRLRRSCVWRRRDRAAPTIARLATRRQLRPENQRSGVSTSTGIKQHWLRGLPPVAHEHAAETCRHVSHEPHASVVGAAARRHWRGTARQTRCRPRRRLAAMAGWPFVAAMVGSTSVRAAQRTRCGMPRPIALEPRAARCRDTPALMCQAPRGADSRRCGAHRCGAHDVAPGGLTAWIIVGVLRRDLLLASAAAKRWLLEGFTSQAHGTCSR